jgi:ElaB/YqjD/DUF883 family membrane-anchored ribosome-binding protein
MNDIISKYTNGDLASEWKYQSKEAIGKVSLSFDDLSNKLAETTAELSEMTLVAMKKHPMQSAMAAGAVGLIAGAIISRK